MAYLLLQPIKSTYKYKLRDHTSPKKRPLPLKLLLFLSFQVNFHVIFIVMTPFLCRVVDARDQPVAGICMTAFPSQGPVLVAVTASDGFASSWTTLDEHRSGHDIRRHRHIEATQFPIFTLGVTRPTPEAPIQTPLAWQCIYVDVRLNPSTYCCVILQLKDSRSYMVQYLIWPIVDGSGPIAGGPGAPPPSLCYSDYEPSCDGLSDFEIGSEPSVPESVGSIAGE